MVKIIVGGCDASLSIQRKWLGTFRTTEKKPRFCHMLQCVFGLIDSLLSKNIVFVKYYFVLQEPKLVYQTNTQTISKHAIFFGLKCIVDLDKL